MAAEAFFPGQAPIETYGNGGFRFAGMSHRGALLLLPAGIFGWNVPAMEALDVTDFARVLRSEPPVEFFLLGTGERQLRPAKAIREAFASAGIGLDSMDTGAAIRTYNVLLAERRVFGAGLIPVENAR
ncbi:MAG: Mth938-like domain-containing protein [Parvibaculaceae bacterium]